MKRTIIFSVVILIGFSASSFLYGQETGKNKNCLKLSALSLVGNAKVQYEKAFSNNSSCGIAASFFYLTDRKGIKIEPFYRYYFKKHAPAGWYCEPKIAVGCFRTFEPYHNEKYVYDPAGNMTGHFYIFESFAKEFIVYPFGGSIRFGCQKYFGKNKRFVFDYNFGLQCFIYNTPRTSETNYYTDSDGNKVEIVTVHGAIEDCSIPTDEIYWYFLGAGSVFQANISIGYNF